MFALSLVNCVVAPNTKNSRLKARLLWTKFLRTLEAMRFPLEIRMNVQKLIDFLQSIENKNAEVLIYCKETDESAYIYRADSKSGFPNNVYLEILEQFGD